MTDPKYPKGTYVTWGRTIRMKVVKTRLTESGEREYKLKYFHAWWFNKKPWVLEKHLRLDNLQMSRVWAPYSTDTTALKKRMESR